MHLGIDALLHQLRRIFTVEAVHFAVNQRLQILHRVFNLRREQVVRHGPHLIAPIDDHVGILDDDLICLFLAEIGELREHFVGGLEIERKRTVCVRHLLGRQKNVAVNFILRIQEMHVAGGDDGLSKLLAQLDDGAVEAAQLLFTFCQTLFQHEEVVAERLHLEEIIERGDAFQLRVALVRNDRLKQLACLAGGADEQTLAPAEHFRLRHDGVALEIFQIAVGNETVEIAQADGVFRKDDDVTRAPIHDLAAAAQLDHRGIDGLNGADVFFLQHRVEPREQVAAGDGVVGCTVMVEVRQAQEVRHDVELVFSKVGQKILRQNERVERRWLERDMQPLTGRRHKADVKVGVVRAERTSAHEFQKLRQNFVDRRRADEHFVGDAGQVDDLRRELPSGRNERLEGVEHLASLHDDGANLDDDVVLSGKTGRFQIECDIFRVEIRVEIAVNDDAVVYVVDIIALAAIENLDVFIRACDLGLSGGLHGVREGLRAAVIGDGDGLVAPRCRLLDGGGGVGQGIHGGHGGVQVQLDALFRRGVLALGRFELLDGIRLHDHLVVVAVKGHFALNAHPHADLYIFQNGLCLVGLHELVDADGASVVGHVEADDPCVALFQLAVLHGKDLALDHDAEHVQIEIADGNLFAVEGLAVEEVAGLLRGLLLRAGAAALLSG